MKKKVLNIWQILCLILAAALVLTGVVLISKVAALKEEVKLLNVQVAELEKYNTELLTQRDYSATVEEEIGFEESADYSNLDIDGWAVQDGVLTVTGSIHVGMFSDTVSSARLELRKGDEVLQTISLELLEGEAEDVYETELTGVSFRIPEISASEELQLWLVVQPAAGNAFSTFGASWYQAGGQLMLITG